MDKTAWWFNAFLTIIFETIGLSAAVAASMTEVRKSYCLRLLGYHVVCELSRLRGGALLHDPAYREANAGARRMEWPRIPSPAGPPATPESAAAP